MHIFLFLLLPIENSTEGYPVVASMCLEVICCLLLSNISGSAVKTLTAVIIKRALGSPFGRSLL